MANEKKKRQSAMYSDDQVDYVRSLYPELAGASGDYVIKHHLLQLDPNMPANKAGGRKVPRKNAQSNP